MPDRHVVGNLRKRDEGHEKAEYGKKRCCQTFVSEVKEHTAKRCKHHDVGSPDQEVEENQRAVPVPRIRPRIEKRESQAPEQPRHHRPKHAAREERNSCPVLHEHENRKDWNEGREKILRAHILSHIDVTGDHRQKINA